MHLRQLAVRNFRGIEEIEVDFDTRVSVIVGPNAAGKTTILEAIRLVKALLAPRTPSEAPHTLQALGLSSPHIQNRMRFNSVLRDPSRDLVIGCRFEFDSKEIADLAAASKQIAASAMQARMGQSFAGPEAFIAFLATSQGKELLSQSQKDINSAIARVQQTRRCFLQITISPTSGVSASSDAAEMQLFAHLERRLPPHKTSFTYFPADRALPTGEQPVQLGGPDAQQQLESYNSQPQTKFNRLKNTIFAATILGESGTNSDVREEFEKIFNGILKGRQLESFGVNEIGFLSVLVRDTETQRTFDLDGMSSGEKGLILTFLIIARSISDGGVVLLDEPELHLNPAVCKDWLPFLVEHYVKPRNLQVLVCSHSPQILAGAFESEECSLYHLVSPTILTKVRPQDEMVVGDALKRLGAMESEGLLYKGIVFVEGPDDISTLEAGWPIILRRFQLKYAIGRPQIERSIRDLQAAEANGAQIQPTFFIFDLDDNPTNLISTKSVRLLQWDRRCLENYLLDVDVLADLMMSPEVAQHPLTSYVEVKTVLRELAFAQLDAEAARAAFAKCAFVDMYLRKDDLHAADISGIADAAMARLQAAQASLAGVDAEAWRATFEEDVRRERALLESVWATEWPTRCNGKQLLSDLYKKHPCKMTLRKLKSTIARELAMKSRENSIEVANLLQNLFAGEFNN